MTCETWREAISSRADGERSTVSEELLDRHLRRCAACREFEGWVRETSGSPVDGAAAHRAGAAAAGAWRRGALVLCALTMALIHLPDLVAADGHDHTGRHAAAFGVSIAIGFCLVAARPGRARALLPIAALIAATLAITAVVDVASGHVPAAGELRHLPELLGAGLLWSTARATAAAARRGTARPGPRGLGRSSRGSA